MNDEANAYVTDGKCHNANRGTFNHECGKPAVVIGTSRSGHRSGYCAHCREHGDEARNVIAWEPHPRLSPALQPEASL